MANHQPGERQASDDKVQIDMTFDVAAAHKQPVKHRKSRWCCKRVRSSAVDLKSVATTGTSLEAEASLPVSSSVRATGTAVHTETRVPHKQKTSCVALHLAEPALMRRTFGAMLHSLCTFQQEIMRANQAKQHFIRYIFHEVRVPFNSVVLCK